MATHLGKKTLVIDTEDYQEDDSFKFDGNRLAGIVSVGGWLIVSSMDKCQAEKYSLLANYVLSPIESKITNPFRSLH